jgi:hypothetical protein
MTDIVDKDGEARIRAAIEAGREGGELENPEFQHVPEEDQANPGVDGDCGSRKPKHLEILNAIAGEAEFFQTPEHKPFADIEVDGHRETWPLRSKQFSQWLKFRFYEETGGTPRPETLQSALDLIEITSKGAPEHTVHVRVGDHAGKLYLDLADKEWRAVEIDAIGWRLVERPPVRFRRAPGMRPLPEPMSGGSIKGLRSFLNVKSEDDFVLVVSWLLAGMGNPGPYPVLVISGEQGSAKSTFSRTLRALLDPNQVPLRALPRDDRDLFIAANNGHVLAFDNVSNLSAAISDTLCRLSTGGGFSVRQLYTDQDEVLFDASRPVILNGIEDIVTRADLADRAIFIRLEAIPDDRRKTEAELRVMLEAESAGIFGALLDGMVEGLKRLPGIRPKKLPRMADFARWATACETTFWSAGTFTAAFDKNRDRAVDDVVDADPVSAAIRTMMATQMEWTGTATELLEDLGKIAGERTVKSRNWPDGARALSNRLHRSVTFLRNAGLEFEFERKGRAGTRTIRIIAARQAASEKAGLASSASSASSAPIGHLGGANVLNGPNRPTPNRTADAADAADANLPSPSAPEKSDWSARI